MHISCIFRIPHQERSFLTKVLECVLYRESEGKLIYGSVDEQVDWFTLVGLTSRVFASSFEHMAVSISRRLLRSFYGPLYAFGRCDSPTITFRSFRPYYGKGYMYLLYR